MNNDVAKEALREALIKYPKSADALIWFSSACGLMQVKPDEEALNFAKEVTGVDFHQPVSHRHEAFELVTLLNAQAKKESEVSQMWAQSKSLRQTDNPENRDDLYAYTKPEDTLSGRAAKVMSDLLEKVYPTFSV